jgi:invasion protein IalB
VLGEKPEQSVALAWKRCLPMGCFADVELSDDLIKRLRSLTDGPRLSFTEGAGRDLALPFSLTGLPQALDALAKEPTGG